MTDPEQVSEIDADRDIELSEQSQQLAEMAIQIGEHEEEQLAQQVLFKEEKTKLQE